MKISLIICSYARPSQLKECLASLDIDGLAAQRGELVLVYTKADPATGEVMRNFAANARVPVQVLMTERLGLSIARNKGLMVAQGTLLAFTDDDCLMRPGYFTKLVSEMDSGPYGYGGGGLHDPVRHAPGASQIMQRVVLQPGTLVGPGIVSGANMFFRRDVFERVGNFREDMGVGAQMPFLAGEDIEFVTRASLAGFTGLLVPDAVIVHQHARPAGSAEEAELKRVYSHMRGAHYVYLMMRGIQQSWAIWAGASEPGTDRKVPREVLERMHYEFEGAAKYLQYCLENDVDVPPKGH